MTLEVQNPSANYIYFFQVLNVLLTSFYKILAPHVEICLSLKIFAAV